MVNYLTHLQKAAERLNVLFYEVQTKALCLRSKKNRKQTKFKHLGVKTVEESIIHMMPNVYIHSYKKHNPISLLFGIKPHIIFCLG